ncbi:MAG: hypothetical protein IKK66_10360 [Ruminococcus sp.]|nr:hypothetical protein [Ruminococcus sp.]
MKKIICGIMTMSLACSLMTACGKDDETTKETNTSITLEANEEIKVTDKKEASTETNDVKKDSDESKTVSDTEKESENKSSENTSEIETNEKGFEKTLYAYFEALNESDYEKALKYFYPAEIVDGLIEVSEIQNTDLTALVASDVEAKSYEITDIEIESEIPKDDLKELSDTMNQMYYTVDTVKNYDKDIDSMSEEELTEIQNKIMNIEENEVEKKYTVTEGYDITVNYLVDGEPDEDYFYVFNVEGDGWMLQNSMRKYIKNSRQSSANADSKTIIIAYNTALTELDEMGANLSGTFILCSDESKNYNVPDDFSIDEINEIVGYYYTFEEDCKYFVIISNGVCHYCAVSAFEDTVGTYPVSAIPKSCNQGTLETEEVPDISDYTFDEIYETAKNIVK